MKNLLLLITSSILSACGHYTKDTYFEPVESIGWIMQTDDTRSKFICNENSAEYYPFNLESIETSFTLFWIPIIPSNKTVSELDKQQPITMSFIYSGNNPNCSNGDISITIDHDATLHYPNNSYLLAHIPEQNNYYCRYWFKEKFNGHNVLYAYVRGEKLGCDSTKLSLSKTTKSHHDIIPIQ